MAKIRSTYVCQQCGHVSPSALGRCPTCGTWGSLVETIDAPATAGRASATLGRPAQPVRLSELQKTDVPRIPVPIAELSRVLGGGLVPGSLVLIGGDPGIGKSTLVLQAAGGLADAGKRVLYVTGEESAQQVKLRADRLNVHAGDLLLLPETRLEVILATASEQDLAALVIDSIQTMTIDDLASAAGSVAQVRECTARLIAWAKSRDIPVLLIGHVTKEGTIAGPRVLEHMVDAVLYLEGERYHQYRVLRAVKNRFGSTNEIGVFEMVEEGLIEVGNPSEAFLADRNANAAGSAVAVTIEGTRPILIEIQALVAASQLEVPRRSVNGLDPNRLQLLVAVLQKRGGVPLGSQDIFTNVVGGLRLDEPAVDLAVAVAVASSAKEMAVDSRTVTIGEIGLSGELRSVGQIDRRLNEAKRLGFRRAVVPASMGGRSGDLPRDFEVVRASTLREAIGAVLR